MICKTYVNNQSIFSLLNDNPDIVDQYLYQYGFLYIHTNTSIKNISKIINVDTNVIQKVTKENINQQPDMVRDWCHRIFVNDDIYNFEHSEEGQKRIKATIEWISNIEKKAKELNNKQQKGVNDNAENKEK